MDTYPCELNSTAALKASDQSVLQYLGLQFTPVSPGQAYRVSSNKRAALIKISVNLVRRFFKIHLISHKQMEEAQNNVVSN